MPKDPNENSEETESQPVDHSAREAISELDGYREYLKEMRGDNLTFGDY